MSVVGAASFSGYMVITSISVFSPGLGGGSKASAVPQSFGMGGSDAELLADFSKGDVGSQDAESIWGAPPIQIAGALAEDSETRVEHQADIQVVPGGELTRGQGFQFVDMFVPIIFQVLIIVKAETASRALEGGAAGREVEQRAVAPGLVGFPMSEELFGYDETRTATVVGEAINGGTVEYVETVPGDADIAHIPKVVFDVPDLEKDRVLVPPGWRFLFASA